MSIALRLALHLPRDAATVPVVRRLLDQALRTLGVEPSCRDDVGLILTEACANVIEHALQIHDYEITIDVSGERCVIHVINAGAVVDPARLAPSPAVLPGLTTSGLTASGLAGSGAGGSGGSGVSAGSAEPGVSVRPDLPAQAGAVPAASAAEVTAAASDVTAASPDAMGAGIAAGSAAGSGAGPVVPAARPSGDGFGAAGGFGRFGGFSGGDGGAVSSASSSSPSPLSSPAAAAGSGDGHADPVLDEHGRGLHIIRSLADELYLTPSLTGGLVLQAVTTLRWTADAEVWQRR
ncbi:ATP-binding protein [Dactylosporangium sp. CS-033363]|uniref:ATP-binding protein n=1 Tax=Dactylosporangium sp. CS-033363 TaxID=3239935 RepID=UPI003D8BEB0E